MAETGKVTIDTAVFRRHLETLHEAWRTNRTSADWGNGAEAIALLHGAAPPGDVEDDSMTRKSVIVMCWLLGFEFTDTFALMTERNFLIVASAKKVQMLSAAAAATTAAGVVEVKLVARTKEDWPAQAKLISDTVRGKKLGIVAKDEGHHIGPFAQQCESLLKEAATAGGTTVVDISPGLAAVMAIKDEHEQRLARFAASVAAGVFGERMIADVEVIIDENRTERHDALAARYEEAISDKALVQDKLHLNVDLVDSCYTPVVQSGGRYDLTPAAENDSRPLHYGTIVLALGVRYRLYCSNVARTLFVNATKDHESAYRTALELHGRLIEQLRPGTKICDAVKAAHGFLEKKRPDLVPSLAKSFGHGIGIEFREAPLVLSLKNANPVKPGMIFNVSVGFNEIKVSPALLKDAADDRAKSFAILISDTVLVTDAGPQVLTAKQSKKWSDVSYVLGDEQKEDQPAPPASSQAQRKAKEEPADDEGEEEEAGDERRPVVIEDELDGSIVPSRLRGREEKPASALEAEKRRQHQQELAIAKQEEARRRLGGGAAGAAGAAGEDGRRAGHEVDITKVRAYGSTADMPPETGLTRITIDAAHESLIVPIFGLMVPFHISTVKNVTTRDDMLRINFVTPVSTLGTGRLDEKLRDHKGLFVRELTYRIADQKVLSATELQIKEIRKRLTARMAESKQEEVEPQEQLRVSRGVAARLSDLSVQPTLTGKKTTGTLEAHTNGFRFTTNRGATLDVLFKNIKHAFFQPAEQELILLIHFHLKSPIMVGKKKTKDIQFYMEVMEVSTALDRQKSHWGDTEEVEEEQREREMRRKHTLSFQNFVKKVEETVPGLEFDIPYRELGFNGAPGRSSVLLQPTVHCLVNLTDTPPFVLSLDDVEIAHFERVSPQFKLRNFDLVFVFKEYTRPVVRINSIPAESLDAVKNWLDSIDVKYYEGPTNLNWAHILTTIREDVEGFLESGGWSFLEPESESEGEEEPEEGSDFDPEEEGSRSGSSSDEDYDDEASSEEEKAAEEEKGGGDEEEEAESWSDLETKAQEEDSKKRKLGDDGDQAAKKQKR